MLKLPLKPFQEIGVEYLSKNNYAILADDMGLGKTPQALALYDKYKLRTLVVCPSYLKYNWLESSNKFLNSTNAHVVKNVKSLEKFDEYFYDIIIVNYEMLDKGCERLFAWAEMVVFDEAHYLKNTSSIRTDTALTYIDKYKPQRCYTLTGTPIENRIGELYPLLRICDNNSTKRIRDAFPTQDKFCAYFMHCRIISTPHGAFKKYYGFKNQSVLLEFMRGKFIRRLKNKVMSELPAKSHREILIDHKDDKALLEAYIYSEGKPGSDSSAKRTSAIAKADFTAKYCAELFEEISEPLVIFSDHPEAASRIKSLLEKKYRVGLIDSSVLASVRQEIVNSFQDNQLQMVIGTIGTMGTGFTLTRASHAVFNDRSWIPGRNNQAEDRINRIGQTKACTFHRIYGTLADVAIEKLVSEKESTNKIILGE